MDKSDRQERAAERKERLAKQLRDNLKKRKQQARARGVPRDGQASAKAAARKHEGGSAAPDRQNKPGCQNKPDHQNKDDE